MTKLFFFKHRQLIGALFTIAILFVPVLVVHGYDTTALPTGSNGYDSNAVPSGSTANSTNNPVTSGAHVLQSPLKFKSVCGLVTGLLDAVMIIGIPVAVLFIVWAGFKFILAQGNPGELTEARSNFLHVIIGIAIFVGASLIAAVIINTLNALGVNGISSSCN